MKKISFKIMFDEEFQDYYIIPFEDYIWVNNDILEDDKGNLVMVTENGFYNVKEINWDEMKVICEI